MVTMELAGCRIRRLLSRRDHDVSRSTSLHDDERTDSRVSDCESDDDGSLASDEEQLLDTTGSHIVSWLILVICSNSRLGTGYPVRLQLPGYPNPVLNSIVASK